MANRAINNRQKVTYRQPPVVPPKPPAKKEKPGRAKPPAGKPR